MRNKFKALALISSAGLMTLMNQGYAGVNNLSEESRLLLSGLADDIVSTALRANKLQRQSQNAMTVALTAPASSSLVLGVTYNPETYEVQDVAEQSTAAEMGVLKADVLVSINGFELADSKSWPEFLALLGTVQQGDEIVLAVVREGQPLSLTGPAQTSRVPSYQLVVDTVNTGSDEELDLYLRKSKSIKRSDYGFRYFPYPELAECASEKCKYTAKQYQGLTEQDFSIADMRLGEFYFAGYGVKRDLTKALSLFKPYAKRAGYSHATYMASLIYKELGDEQQAEKYLKLAASKRSVAAMFDLALLYLNEDNRAEADLWFSRTYQLDPVVVSNFVRELKVSNLDLLTQLPQLMQVVETVPELNQRDGDGTSAVVRHRLAKYSPQRIFNAEITRRQNQLTMANLNELMNRDG